MVWDESTFSKSNITLQQDGVTFHIAILAQDWYRKHVASFWTKKLWPLSNELYFLE